MSPGRSRRTAPGGLVRHLQQVFEVDMQEAGLIGLERPLRFSGGFGSQGIEIAHAMPPQTTIKARPRHIRVQELTANRQKITKRQQKKMAQLDDHRTTASWAVVSVVCSLCGVAERSSTLSRRFHLRAVSSLTPPAQRQNRCGFVAPAHLLTNAGGRRRVLVQ